MIFKSVAWEIKQKKNISNLRAKAHRDGSKEGKDKKLGDPARRANRQQKKEKKHSHVNKQISLSWKADPSLQTGRAR